MATDDQVVQGEVHDRQRIAFLNRRLEAFGYERRFGIIHVDYATQKRTLKQSAKLVAKFLAERAAQN